MNLLPSDGCLGVFLRDILVMTTAVVSQTNSGKAWFGRPFQLVLISYFMAA